MSGLITENTIFKYARDNGWDGNYADDEVGQRLKQLELQRTFEKIPGGKVAESNFSYDIEKLREYCLTAEAFQELKLSPRVKYMDPWILAQAIILITANRGVGKTFFVQSLLDAISRGNSFGPWHVNRSVPCLFYDAELVAQDTKDRLDMISGEEDRVSPFYILSDALLVEKGKRPKGNLQSAEWRAVMKELLLELGVKVWALDNISSASTGATDENSSADWREINSWLLELRYAGITTILVHHTNKTGVQRGTHSREDNIDISLMLRRPNGYQLTDGAAFEVVFTKARLPTRDLSKINDVSFMLVEDADGKSVWETNRPRQDRTMEILRLTDKGLNQTEIAEKLNCTKQNVSATLKRARLKKWVTDEGAVTDEGRAQFRSPVEDFFEELEG